MSDPVKVAIVDPLIDHGLLGDAFHVGIAARVLSGQIPAESIDVGGLAIYLVGLSARLRKLREDR